MAASVFENLGLWVANLTIDDVPEAAREVARRAIIDSVGVTMAANDGDIAQLLGAYRSPAPVAGDAATIIGQQASAPAETAAFTNGVLGHALDFDDCSEPLGGHPTIVIFPAALAAAELTGASGAKVLEGYIAGFEVATAIGRAVNFAHYEGGWHPTATLGVFGGAAAAAKVLGLDAERTATALAIAASLAAGIKANFGTMTKPLQAGRAAQNGLFAARMAQLGATANPGAFEDSQGFVAVHQGLDNADLSGLQGEVKPSWDLIDTGVTMKRFPCCASTHGAIEAALAIREQLGSADDIESVQIWTHPRRLKHTNRPEPVTGFQGKFSVQYTVSTALHQGAVGMNDFSEEAIARPEVQRILGRVRADEMPEERWGVDHFPAEVEVTTRAGDTIRHRIEKPRGNGVELALTAEEIRAKFMDCCQAGGLDEQPATALVERLWGIEQVEDLPELTKLLA